MKKYKIGIFDSGVGGITVLKEIIKLLPNENILYYGDSKNAPYGEKSQEEIQKLSEDVTKFLIKEGCSVIVIACNTATAGALEYLRGKYPVHIIGVIDGGAKTALDISKNKKINIISTPFTAKSQAYMKKIREFSKEAQIYQEGCPTLCPMIEDGWKQENNEILEKHLNNLSKDADTLILGCTHYPLIIEEIEKYFSGNIVEPSYETAMELKKYMEKEGKLGKGKGEIAFYISGDKEKFIKIAEKFLNIPIKLY